jgi:hypothetical protein
MSPRAKTISKAASAGGLLLVALALGISRLHHVTATGEEGARIWFYDQSEQKLYAVPRDTIPPHPGIGGTKGDGVRAIVVALPQEQKDPAKRQIAYLETYTLELQELLEGVRAARAAGQPYAGKLPDSESNFIQKNTLVRRPTESSWHDIASPEGQKIMTEWRKTLAPEGQPLVVCVP